MLNTISFFNVLYFVYFLHRLFLQHGDIVINLGPQSGQVKNLSFGHWNVNSLVARNLSFKESLSVQTLNLANLSECIICKVSMQNYKVYIGVNYRSRSQNNPEFEDFLSNFEDILNTTVSSSSLFTIILGDFIGTSSSWWKT